MTFKEKYAVLVVDDVADTRELFAEVLMHEGYHSIMAGNGREALARLAYVEPEVIVTDLDMAEMDGAELIGHVRRDERFKKIPIIVITGSDQDRVARALGEFAAEVFAVLRKPVRLNDLLSAVAKAAASRT